MPFPTAPTTFIGSSTTPGAGFNQSTAAVPARLKPLIYDSKIVDWESDLFPTASIVMGQNRKTKSAMVWSRWERQPYPHWINVDAAITAADTDFTTSGDMAQYTRSTRYDLWMCVRTKEVMHFVADSASGAGTVTRGVGRYPAQAMVAGDKLVKVGTAFPGGSVAPKAHAVLPEEKLFYATHHQISFEATADLLASKMLVEPNWFEGESETRRAEFNSILKRSFFGSGSSSTAGTVEQQNTVKGLIDHCQTWTYNVNGVLTKPDLFGFLGDGPGRYIKGNIGIACSSFGLNIINGWLDDISRAEVGKNIDSIGFDVDGLKLVNGRRAKLFYESWLDEDPLTQGWIFVFPLNKVQGSSFVTVNGPSWNGAVRRDRDIKTEDGYLGRKDRWYCCYGWEHGPELGYGFVYGIEG